MDESGVPKDSKADQDDASNQQSCPAQTGHPSLMDRHSQQPEMIEGQRADQDTRVACRPCTRLNLTNGGRSSRRPTSSQSKTFPHVPGPAKIDSRSSLGRATLIQEIDPHDFDCGAFIFYRLFAATCSTVSRDIRARWLHGRSTLTNGGKADIPEPLLGADLLQKHFEHIEAKH
jgi:hypothetical protein